MARAKRPYKINQEATEALRARVNSMMIAVPEDWTIYATNTVQGRCYYHNKCISVPVWAIWTEDRDVEIHEHNPAYCVYYVCHELAHACAGIKAQHGPVFMEWFKTICPVELQHFELNYKPRLAAAAGIRRES